MNVEQFLREHGYLNNHPDPTHREATIYYKKMPGTIKHQIAVREWPAFPHASFASKVTYEVEMTYETAHGIWAMTKFYGLDAGRLMDSLLMLEERLKNSLIYMGANPGHYRQDKE